MLFSSCLNQNWGRPGHPCAVRVRHPPDCRGLDVVVPVPAGHLDRGGGRGPGLLRAGAGGYRAGRRGRGVPLLLCRTAFPARRQPDADRAAQRVTRPGAGDRPDRAARRPGHQPAARGADRHAGRQLGRARSRFGQRHAGQRLRDRGGDQVPLDDGDRINLGAWTAITVRTTTGDPRH